MAAGNEDVPAIVHPEVLTALLEAAGKSPVVALQHPEADASTLRVFHRQPDPAVTDRRSPRSVALDAFMAIEPTALERAFSPYYSDDDVEREYEVKDRVAILCIDGPLMQRGGWWWMGYDCILDQFDDALKDAEVDAIVLKINSPGGVCSGCFTAARSMLAMKAEAGKKIYAYADESAYSAAYAIASVADEIYLPREGGVGSVGVIGTLQDWSAYNERVGIKVAVVTSGKHKADGHPDVALTKDVIARYQVRVNMLAQSFAEIVASSRGMTPEAVLGLEAACFYGEEAVTAGLANGVRSFEDVMALATAEAGRRVATRGQQAPSTYGATRKDIRMTTKTNEGTTLLPILSFASIALAIGLSHEATEGDVLAAIGKTKADHEKAVAMATKLLEAHGAKSAEEAIGKLEAERSTHEELVAVVVGKVEAVEGQKAEKPTARDAIAKLAADRKAQTEKAAAALIEQAIADGKVQANGEKAFGIFSKHGMEALEAHLDALAPHAALSTAAPTQKSEKGATHPSATSVDVVLTPEDEASIKALGLDRDAFVAMRKEEATRAREIAAKLAE